MTTHSKTIPVALVTSLLLCAPGCGESTGTAPDDLSAAPDFTAPIDASTPPDLAVSWAGRCAPDFGSGLTAPYGRLDGTLWAVVEPSVMSCAAPNGTHLVLQIAAGGDVYRMVVNVLSDRAVPDPRVSMLEMAGTVGPVPWAEGWHAAKLDYALTLGLQSDRFVAMQQAELIAAIEARLTLGAPISVYASTSGGASAHLVHRNIANQDGAILVDPTSNNPRLLLFRFADQVF